MFTSTKKHVEKNQLDLIPSLPQEAGSENHQDDERILGSTNKKF